MTVALAGWATHVQHDGAKILIWKQTQFGHVVDFSRLVTQNRAVVKGEAANKSGHFAAAERGDSGEPAGAGVRAVSEQREANVTARLSPLFTAEIRKSTWKG